MKYLIVITIFFVAMFVIYPEIDLLVSGAFYSEEQGGFFLKSTLFAVFFREFIYIMSYSIGAILVLSAIAKKTGILSKLPIPEFKKIMFLILVMAIGPGILVHWVVKESWDRPRPRETTEFGGNMEFVRALKPSDIGGKSFVSGHTAMGFYVVAFSFLATGRRRKDLYTLGLFFGVLTGISRIIQGAHFLSDTVFAALLTLFTMHILYWLLFKRDKNKKSADE